MLVNGAPFCMFDMPCQTNASVKWISSGHSPVAVCSMPINLLLPNTFRPEQNDPWVHLTTSQPYSSLQWRHNERDGVSNHQPHDCLLNHLFRRRSKKTSKIRVTGLCVVNSPVIGEFPTQRASNAENVSIWWRHHDTLSTVRLQAITLTSDNSVQLRVHMRR